MTTKENLERVAYTAVGAPVAGIKAARAKAEELAESVRGTRKDIKSDALREFDQWVEEGEIVVDRVLEWFRSTGASSDLRSARRMAADQVRSGVDELSDKIDRAMDMVEPDIELTEVRGIGVANAHKLATVGVGGIAGLLQMTRTEQDRQRLSDETGIGTDTLEGWRRQADLTQIDGIGEAYQRMLHAVGVGTLTHLANAATGDLVAKMSAVEHPSMPEQMPGESEVSGWIREAGRLSLR